MSLSTANVTNLSQLYDQDFVLWINATAELLREGKLNELDIPNLLEEVETMGRSEKTDLTNHLVKVLVNLLKYQYQPEKRTNDGLSLILKHRFEMEDILEASPSLNDYLREDLPETYQHTRDLAAIETGLDLEIFPKDCPYSPEQILDIDYLPEH